MKTWIKEIIAHKGFSSDLITHWDGVRPGGGPAWGRTDIIKYSAKYINDLLEKYDDYLKELPPVNMFDVTEIFKNNKSLYLIEGYSLSCFRNIQENGKKAVIAAVPEGYNDMCFKPNPKKEKIAAKYSEIFKKKIVSPYMAIYGNFTPESLADAFAFHYFQVRALKPEFPPLRVVSNPEKDFYPSVSKETSYNDCYAEYCFVMEPKVNPERKYYEYKFTADLPEEIDQSFYPFIGYYNEQMPNYQLKQKSVRRMRRNAVFDAPLL